MSRGLPPKQPICRLFVPFYPVGCWFLTSQVAGYSARDSSALSNLTTNGNWWSSTGNTATNAYNLNFNDGTVNPENTNTKDTGRSVRC